MSIRSRIARLEESASVDAETAEDRLLREVIRVSLIRLGLTPERAQEAVYTADGTPSFEGPTLLIAMIQDAADRAGEIDHTL